MSALIPVRDAHAQCRLCGGDKVSIDSAFLPRRFFIRCDGCGSTGDEGDNPYIALSAWNRAAQPPHQPTTAMPGCRR